MGNPLYQNKGGISTRTRTQGPLPIHRCKIPEIHHDHASIVVGLFCIRTRLKRRATRPLSHPVKVGIRLRSKSLEKAIPLGQNLKKLEKHRTFIKKNHKIEDNYFSYDHFFPVDKIVICAILKRN
jgi:hypothetical protein